MTRFSVKAAGLLAGLTAAIALASAPAQAAEGGGSPYLRGLKSYQSGIVAPVPGFYVSDTVYVYDASADATVLQGHVQADVKTTAVVDLISGTVVYPAHLLGANVASNIVFPISHVDLSGTLTTPLGARAASTSTLANGDVTISPLILGWHFGKVHLAVGTAVTLPLGHYESTKVLNAGRNTYGITPNVSLTYFNPKSGWDVSLATAYVITTRNPSSDYQSGNIAHFDLAIGKQVTKTLKLGVAGYGLIQVTDDSGGGAKLGPFRSRVWGAGPAITYGVKIGNKPVSLGLRFYDEFGARNTFEGQEYFFSLATKV